MEKRLRILALESSSRCASVALLELQLDTSGFSDSIPDKLERNAIVSDLNKRVKIVSADSTTQTGLTGESTSRPEFGTKSATSDKRKKRPPSSSVTLLPRIQQALRTANWQPSDVDFVAVSIGPGSFTGLRIGLVTAKTFAFATEAQVIAVNTLETIATQTLTAICSKGDMPQPNQDFDSIRVAIDAQRGQLFACEYEIDGTNLVPAKSEFSLVNKQDWLAQFSKRQIASGPALLRMKSDLSVLDKNQIAPESSWQPRAATIGRIAISKELAIKKPNNGGKTSPDGHVKNDFNDAFTEDWWKLEPLYLRPSYAEE